MSTRRRDPLPPDSPLHGTLGGYTNHLCRCAPCTAAQAEQMRQWRSKQLGYRTRAEYDASRLPEHRTLGRYRKGCRCADCRRAAADYRYRMRRNKALREGRDYGTQRDWVIDYRLGRTS